jgi:hypothetical protein
MQRYHSCCYCSRYSAGTLIHHHGCDFLVDSTNNLIKSTIQLRIVLLKHRRRPDKVGKTYSGHFLNSVRNPVKITSFMAEMAQ